MSDFRNRSRSLQILIIFLFAVLLYSCTGEPRDKRILVFSKTSGWRHESIEAGKAALLKLGAENDFKVDTTENAVYFSEDSLQKYSAVVFLNTTLDVLDHRQEADFERYIQAGGGFVGIHAAADTEYHWGWYNKLVGAYFNGHPNDPNVRKATVDVIDREHPSTEFLPKKWERSDEWYDYKSINPNVKILATLDEKTYEGGKHGNEDHPIAWYHEFDGGRAFYTGGGHTDESYVEPLFVQHLLEGINYAIGTNKQLDYSKAKTFRVPEENRFVQVVLDEFLDEPIQMGIMPDNKVLFVERRGNVKLYDPEVKKTKVIAKFDVNTTGNYEDGLLGMALDPDFKNNRWVYFYYSPLGGVPKQNLSRFYLAANDSLILGSEKIILEVPVQRETCCHSAGSIQFGPDGMLYLSTGDNTSSKESDGYSPLDERPGRGPFDSQKSSGNTNDLRGKILRIIPQKDGSYKIPEGNLFAKGTPQTRPEIYIMGARNPYRITIDPKTNVLYWGDVGPDAGKPGPQGPESYDEWNKASQPGNYGWPYFQADNKAFNRFDFATNEVGEKFDPAAPVNTSPNNTGKQELPPAQKPFIWYPYGESKEFPMLGTGSRSAMAGPVFYSDMFLKGKRFPEYYNGKLFIYEWARSWVKVVTFDEEGNLSKIEPFLPGFEISKPIDVQFGPDGALYMLTYGENYFARNPDAKLIKIDYSEGNRAPVPMIAADKKVGAAPLTVNFSAKGSIDYDKDELTYEWMFASNDVESTEESPKFTFDKPGIYKPKVKVTDKNGESATTEIEIKVGNETPVVDIETDGNKSFYWDNKSFKYQVKVTDKEDGSLEKNSIDPSNVFVSVEYLKVGKDLALLEESFQPEARSSFKHLTGKNLIDESDCKSCHSIEKKSIGPSYKEIADKYKNDTKTVDFLAEKIILGGSGNWGKNMMAAHPQHSKEETTEMVHYILSLAESGKSGRTPLNGSFSTTEHIGNGDEGSYYITASYTDKGSEITGPLTGKKILRLRHPKVQAEEFNDFENVGIQQALHGDVSFVNNIKHGSYIMFKDIDLTNIEKITFNLLSVRHGGTIEIRTGAPDGKLLGSAEVPEGNFSSEIIFKEITADIAKTSSSDHLYLVFKNEDNKDEVLFNLDWIYFKPDQGFLSAR